MPQVYGTVAEAEAERRAAKAAEPAGKAQPLREAATYTPPEWSGIPEGCVPCSCRLSPAGHSIAPPWMKTEQRS